MSATTLLADVRAALRVLWVGGLQRPDPTLPSELADLAIAARAVGLEGLGDALTTLQVSLGPEHDANERFAAQRALWVRSSLLAEQLRLHLLGASLHEEAEGTVAEAPVLPPGRDTELWPLGVEVRDGQLQLHCLDPAGGWVTLEDRPLALDPDDLANEPITSRLFQGEVCLGDVLDGQIELVRHPGVATAARWVGGPAFHTRPRLRSASTASPALPALPPGARLAVGTGIVTCRRGPDGWVASSGGVPVAVSPLLAFDLDKRTRLDGTDTVRIEGVLVARGDRRVLLSEGEPPAFPTLDPATTRWPLSGWTTHLPADEAAQLGAMAWPVIGGDRSALAAALAPAASSADLATRWAAQWAGRAIGLPPPDRNPGARAWLGRAEAGSADAIELLRALWLHEQHDPVGATLAALLREARDAPLDDDDWVEIALRAWLTMRAAPDTAVPFLAAHGERLGPGRVLPDAEGLLWVHHAWHVVASGKAELPPLALPRLAAARVALSALPSLDGWRWAAACDALRWLLSPAGA